MIPIKLIIWIIVVLLILLLIKRKLNGDKGTWDSRKEIEEFAYLTQKPIVLSQSAQKDNKETKKITESIGEKICRNHLNKRLRKEFVKIKPDFLKNPITKCNLELDCFCEELKLALEYNGKQHYEFIPKFHKNMAELYSQKYRDEMKKRLCVENGIDLIEVPYTVKHVDIPIYIDACLEKLGRIKLV